MFDLSELSGRPTTWEMKEAFYSLEEWASETVITSGGLSKYNPTPGTSRHCPNSLLGNHYIDAGMLPSSDPLYYVYH